VHWGTGYPALKVRGYTVASWRTMYLWGARFIRFAIALAP